MDKSVSSIQSDPFQKRYKYNILFGKMYFNIKRIFNDRRNSLKYQETLLTFPDLDSE